MICLKNRTFAVSQTTKWPVEPSGCRLWFAWKIVLLQYRKQQRPQRHCQGNGCDLLEKSYFCSIANNVAYPVWISYLVVICLKNRTFAVSQTTPSTAEKSDAKLWFAWKIVLLQYRKQHTLVDVVSAICCDLLEKSYFCSIANNWKLYVPDGSVLWFAWKIVLLQYRKQRSTRKLCLVMRCDLLEKSYFCSIANNWIPST